MQPFPTAAMLAGDFTGQPTIYDPTTQTVDANGVIHRTSFADEYHNGNKIPANLIDPVAKAMQAYYPQPNYPGTVIDGVTTNNYFYNLPGKLILLLIFSCAGITTLPQRIGLP